MFQKDDIDKYGLISWLLEKKVNNIVRPLLLCFPLGVGI